MGGDGLGQVPFTPPIKNKLIQSIITTLLQNTSNDNRDNSNIFHERNHDAITVSTNLLRTVVSE